MCALQTDRYRYSSVLSLLQKPGFWPQPGCPTGFPPAETRLRRKSNLVSPDIFPETGLAQKPGFWGVQFLKGLPPAPFRPWRSAGTLPVSAGSSVRRPRSRLSVICTACSQLSRVTVSCALTVSESLIKIDDVALEHCCSLGGPGARRGWRERRSEVVMYDIV